MIFPVVMTEHILVFFVAGSQYDKLHIVAAEFVHDTLNQV